MIGDADFEGVDGYGVYVGAVPLVELERCFFLDDVDRALIGKRRGDHNRLGFAAQLGTVRYLGLFLSDPTALPTGAVDYLARQIGVTDSSCLKHYLDRRSTRFSHAAEIVDRYHYRDFNMVEVELAGWIDDRAWTTGDGPKALFDRAVGCYETGGCCCLAVPVWPDWSLRYARNRRNGCTTSWPAWSPPPKSLSSMRY
jgi:Domain of unknown function (DUF4158)